jgi:hypothetical protein
VFTIDEVTRLIASRFKDIYDVKAVFPDSEVVRVTETGEGKTPMNWETGDEIPF